MQAGLSCGDPSLFGFEGAGPSKGISCPWIRSRFAALITPSTLHGEGGRGPVPAGGGVLRGNEFPSGPIVIPFVPRSPNGSPAKRVPYFPASSVPRTKAQRSGFCWKRRRDGAKRMRADRRAKRREVRDDDGPLVKRLRRRPLTPQTWVRFPHGSPSPLNLRFSGGPQIDHARGE